MTDHTVTPERRLREALEALLDDTQHAEHDCGDPKCPVDRARAALAATSSPEPGLDVERLARALHLVGTDHYRGWQDMGGAEHMGMADPTHRETAEELAAEYARLASEDKQPA